MLNEKLTKNKERLSLLLQKKENLEREILNLERKIENQEFALKHQSNGKDLG